MEYDVITIGTATRDVFLQSPLFTGVKDPHFTPQAGFPEGEAECFALGKKIEIEKPILTTGGGSTNSAVTFARQGFKTAAIISLGKDAVGKDIISELKKEGVKPIVSYAKDLHTAYSTILLSPNGERTILVYRGASDYVARVALPKLKTRAVYVVPGAIPVERMRRFVDHFHAQGALVAINPSGHYVKMGLAAMKGIFEKSSVVIMNREEAATLTGISFENQKDMIKKLSESVLGLSVITDGSRGVMVYDGKTLFSSGIFKEQKVIDRTGAGDAFGSAFVAGLLHQNYKLQTTNYKLYQDAIQYAIRLGSANATSKVEHIGAKEGLLTKARFESEERWKNLPIETNTL